MQERGAAAAGRGRGSGVGSWMRRHKTREGDRESKRARGTGAAGKSEPQAAQCSNGAKRMHACMDAALALRCAAPRCASASHLEVVKDHVVHLSSHLHARGAAAAHHEGQQLLALVLVRLRRRRGAGSKGSRPGRRSAARASQECMRAWRHSQLRHLCRAHSTARGPVHSQQQAQPRQRAENQLRLLT